MVTAINSMEKRALVALAGIFSLRMLGLFMILPAFSLYAIQLNYTTPLLAGVALGIYGLTQGLLQIPYGFTSDRVGRKPLILIGLVIFTLGSVVCAMANSIYGVIAGRALQGASAIGSVIMALVSDLTRQEVRVRAMAVIGITIGGSFALSMLLGPLISAWIGVKGIFLLTAIFSVLAIVVLIFFVPTPQKSRNDTMLPVLADIPKVLFLPELILLNFGVLILHMSLIAIFLKIPLHLKAMGFLDDESWKFYFPVFLCALLSTVPCIMMIERRKYREQVLLVMMVLLAFSELCILIFLDHCYGLAFGLWVFFTAFNTLEGGLPSLVSQVVPPQYKGTALGIYSSCQFLGLFLGGALGGWLDLRWGAIGVLLFCAILAIIWLVGFYIQMKRGLQWQEG